MGSLVIGLTVLAAVLVHLHADRGPAAQLVALLAEVTGARRVAGALPRGCK